MLRFELTLSLLILSFMVVGCSKANMSFQSADTQSASKSQSEADGESTCPSSVGEVCVAICHIPPGNPDARHTIWVGRPAVETHIHQHGDFVGTCEDGPVDDSGDDGGDDPTPPDVDEY